jgi:hypothetical protein
MAIIKYNNVNFSFDFELIKFFKVNDMFEFYRDYINGKCEIWEENNNFNNTKTIVITPCTKIKDIFSFNKTNSFGWDLLQWGQNNDIKIFNSTYLDAIKEYISSKTSYVGINEDVDFLKTISLGLNWDNEKMIEKKDLITLINIVNKKSDKHQFLIFNIDWIDQEVFDSLQFNNIKTIFVFNSWNNIKDIISSNREEIVLITDNNISSLNKQESVEEQLESKNGKLVFLKI